LESQGQAVDWNAVNENLSQFSRQTARSIRDFLGEERFQKMKQSQLWPFDEEEPDDDESEEHGLASAHPLSLSVLK
jgi:hypothetical protein